MHWGEHIRNIISGMFIYALISLIIPFFNPYISLFNYFFPKVDNYEISKRNQFDEIKKKSSPPESLSQFQPNLSQSILG